MIKILAALVALGLSFLTVFLIGPAKTVWFIVLIIAFLIAYIILEAIIFFLSYIILGLFVPKGEIKKYNKFYHKIYIRTTTICMSLFGVKMKVTGLDKVPNDTTFVVVHNHLSNMDPIILNTVLKKYDLTFMAKKSLSKIPFFGKIVRKVGFLFLDRDNPTRDAFQIARGIKYLKSNTCSVAVAPEGTRNFTNEVLLPFKDGSFIMATKAQKPVVVCVFKGTENIKKNLLFSIHKVSLDFTDCFYPEEFNQMSQDELSEKVRESMLKVLTEESTK